MNKKIKILFIIILSFICTNKAKAFYTASAGVSWNSKSGVECNKVNCYSSKNNNKLILQARLYYIDNASFTQVGETYYFVNENAYNSNDLNGINLIYISVFNGYSGNDKYQQASNYLKNTYFKDTTKAKEYLKKVTGSTNYNEVLTKISNSSKGYRIMIEPALIYGNPSFGGGNIALMTPKGLASEKVITRNSPICNNCTPLLGNNSMAQYIYMTSSELGIRVNNDKYKSSKEYCGSLNESKLGDIKIGCGYNLINISNLIEVKCYKMEVTENNLECKNYDKNNEGEYQESYTELSNCTDQSTADQYKEYGKLYNTNGTCKIYCKETGTISLPGNMLTPIQRGSYFPWPTKPNDKTGKYKMTMSTKLTCKITDTGGSTSVIASNFTRKCKTGYVQYEDECRKTTSTNKVCPEGTTEIDGSCYKLANSTNRNPRTTATVTTEKICPSGYESTGLSGDSACRKFSRYSYSCPSGYKGSWSSSYTGSIPESNARCCPDGYDFNYYVNGGENACYKWVTQCPSGTTDTNNGSTTPCKKWTGTTYSCSSGTKEGTVCVIKSKKNYSCSSGNRRGEYCYINKKNIYQKCSTGWADIGNQCRKKATVSYSCPTGWNFYKGSSKCSQAATATQNYSYVEKKPIQDFEPSKSATEKIIYYYSSKNTCPSGYSGTPCSKTITIPPTCDGNGELVLINNVQKCAVCPSGYTYYKDGKCKSNQKYDKVCPWNDEYVLIDNTCYHRTSTTENSYSCPVNYNISNNNRNCTKQCNKDNLKTTIDDMLKNEKTSVKLKGGTNKTIDENLSSEILEQKYDTNSLEYSKTTAFYIGNNRNRYYNKLTEEVSDTGTASKTIFDRQEGVISLSKNDIVLENNLIKKYPLEIKILGFGLNNQFGKKITNYVCHYTLTDTPECRCKEGTKNAGDLVSELAEKTCNIKNESCAELQEKLCDYDPSTDSKLTNCNETYSCIQKNNTKLDITSCVKEKVKENTLGDAIKICEIEKECSDNTCTGECKESNINVDNIEYKTLKCNNHYCDFQVYCNDEDKKTSYSSYDCIKDELKTDNILETLNNGITIDKIESAIRSCEKEICASKEKIVFRIIDLKNPFPGKNNQKNNIGFSTTGKSRKPGYNWNSKTVVKNQILNARGVEDYNLYNKEPLYKITLTPSDIKAIREYNKNNRYNNFELKCVNNNSSDCISYFLHSSVTGLNTDIKIEGVDACKNLNLSSTKEDFDKCYNFPN